MLSYIGKGTVLFFFLYTSLVPYTITNSFADNYLASEKKESVKKNNHPPPSVITKNIQMAGNILSSSPSELAEQAKSYAIGQFNSTVASGTQKWLSQFGTVRINFGLDRKGTLKNNSFDLLLPLYDNKADWLFFSQLGYRNKDSRNTMNLGLGGRYFYQDWMYGLNIFYDYDLTGKNQRLGLGGEIGGDYIKLSANTYYRLSNWKNSRNFAGYYERPANGYDINGEFFLPAYPHLGAKLSYQQYLGDDVTLFNRNTKQKNPVLATLGLSYTPVPLFTLGVDYKQGGSGHSETQFLANFNYKLGVPLSMQLSPENVAAARALAGSRYDLVERNNHIVLEHQKKPIPQLSLPETIVGYSQEQHEVTVKLSSDAFVKQIHWTTNKDFEKNGGKLSSRVGHTIKITLPKYLSGGNQNNNYPIYALAELEDDQKLAPVAMHVIVRPFILKQQEGNNNFTPTGPLPATGNKNDGYTFDPVITFDTVNRAPIKNATISHVLWITDPKTGPDTGLQWIGWESSDSVELDENGHFKHKPILMSTRPHKDVKVYLQLDSQPPQLVGEVSFDENPANFHVEVVKVSPSVPSQVANGTQTYTYSAVVLDSDNNPVRNQKIANVKWSVTRNGHDLSANPNLKLTNDGDTTGNQGELVAYLKSIEAIQDVVVSLSIEGQQPVPAQPPVTFTEDTQDYKVKGDIQVKPSGGIVTADGVQKYTYTAIIVGLDRNPVFKKNISNATWKIEHPDNMPELTLDQSDKTTDDKGQLTATLTSIKAVQGVVVSLTVGKQQPIQAKPPVDFEPEQVSITPTPSSPILVGNNYTLTVNVKDATGKNSEPNKQVNWTLKNPNQKGVTLSPTSSTTQGDGSATTTLTSTQAQTVTVEASVEGVETATSVDVEFKWPTIHKPTVTEKTGTVPADGDKDPQHAYHYTAHVVGADGKTPYTGQEIKFKWRLKGTPQNTWLSEKGEVTAQSDGTLKVQLRSSEKNPVATGVIVCLAAVDENSVEISETEQCADAVDFDTENLKIDSLDVAFDPNHPITGGSGGHYTYTAKVVNADGTALPDGYKVEGAKWTLDPAPGTYNGQAEWEIKGDNDNIVTNGQITATLSSQVGIGDISNGQVTDGLTVKLEVPAGRGKTTSSQANQQVAFEAPTLNAGLHVFSDKYPTGKIFKEQNKPYNTFQNLKGELVDASTGKPIAENSKSVNYDANPKVIDSGGTSIGDTSTNSRWDKGIISFNFISTAVSNLKVITTVKKTNNAKYIYTYEFNVKRYFFGSPDGLITIPNDFNCATDTGATQKMTDYELYRGSGSDIDLITEFGDISKYGIVGNPEFIIGVGQSQNKGQNFIYDLKNNTHSFDSNNTTPGYAMCVDHG
ncbi:inverse autotransporter beta domain-containing protein [Xenorhabdus griffiniae]|uniref:inverse autotransporter beta domain-containing protein n=1 Tax=Xenorhabdus griffiniae TaxID=351672 RepID=UPI0023583499|nr:inverse autotransporter beta domain-containing protein [Xenorhabdus griffiniae]MDC9605074.1 inverse autotransporter beta domain-containing protein [Xenorhabdus griffiniae]